MLIQQQQNYMHCMEEGMEAPLAVRLSAGPDPQPMCRILSCLFLWESNMTLF